MIKIIKHLKPYLNKIILVIILTFGQVMSNLKLPEYMAEIINDIINGQNQAIIILGAKMLLVSIAGAFCIIAAGYLASRVSTDFSMEMRDRIFRKTQTFSLAELNHFSISSLITRSTNDIQQVQNAVFMMMRMMLIAPITAIGATIMAIRTAPSLTWIMATGILVLIIVILILFRFGMPKFRQMQETIDQLNAVSRESLTGLRVIRAFGAEKYEEDKFNQTNTKLSGLNLFLGRLMATMQPSMGLIYNFTALGAIWFGAQLIEMGTLPIGNMMAFLQYSMQVLFSFMMISMIFIIMPRASISAERIMAVLESDIIIKEKEDLKNEKPKNNTLKFDKVNFRYLGAEHDTLHRISFEATPGQTVAIVGSTGSGKTTLAHLIPRLYDPSSGKISIGEMDIKEIPLAELRKKISFVPQRSILFSGTIEENIKYGNPDASDEEMEKISIVAQAEEFVNKNSDKFDAAVAQNGANFSGGQKQRLSIARGLLKDAEVYIFDDSFSALDYATEARLRSELANAFKGKTIIQIAQRISTVIDADKIIVLDNGKIVGQGRHTELLQNCDIYKEIALSQSFIK